MSKHREILPEAVDILGERFPGCAVLLWGSVQRGCERPDSDLDLIVVHNGDGKMVIDHSWSHEGIEMCMTYFPVEYLARELHDRPYLYWPFAQTEQLCDRENLSAPLQELARSYFRDNPEVARFWEDHTRNYRNQKVSPSTKNKALAVADLVRSLNERFGSRD